MDDQVAKRSREYLESGFWCAESVLLAVAEVKGVQSDMIPKIATGFCSGMARTGSQCGALSGGIMSIGLLLGRSIPGSPVNAVYSRVEKLRQDFEEQFGSTSCSELLGLDLGTEEGLQKYHAENMREHCLAFTEATTRMVMALLDDPDLG
jgi:C_GCAxxG_C_C family probable redox protein